MSLSEYQRKRHFHRTAEPPGKKAKSPGWSFVVQKHAASRLHYDLRLELDGVLKSWAVPKGPCLDPSQKRLAMQVEDHPVDYGNFEGIIPQGEYGGGTVMLWDRGTWAAVDDAQEGYRSGKLKFQLHGEKLAGGWFLVRQGASSGRPQRKSDDGKHVWFLIKERDAEARPLADGDIVEDQPLSVASGRDLAEIAADRDRTWSSQHKQAAARAARTKASPRKSRRAASAQSRAAADYDRARQEFAGVRLTSPDKVMYPGENITKLDLANYYAAIADWILPQIQGRPLVLVRCPEGHQRECFYQKHPAVGTPGNLRQIPIREKSKTGKYLVVDDAAGLISLAQIGALEIHAWGSREDKLERPDRLVFDLDPDPSVSWRRVIESAGQIRQFLADLGLESFAKTTGGKGLHLVVPILRRHDWDDAKEFCKTVAEFIVAADPSRYTANMSKAARSGKIFIDYLRNGRGATAVAAYSTRARSGAPVAAPVSWDELTKISRADQFTIQTLPRRLASLRRDPWQDLDQVKQSLSASVRKKLVV